MSGRKVYECYGHSLIEKLQQIEVSHDAANGLKMLVFGNNAFFSQSGMCVCLLESLTSTLFTVV